METNEYIIMCMNRVREMLYICLEDLTLEEVCKRPGKESNNIAWTVWHMTRGFDRRISLISGEDQIWILEQWYKSYNLPASDKDLGIGHTSNEVSKIIPIKLSVLTEYYESVHKKMLRYFNNNQQSNDYNKIIPETENTKGYEAMRMVAGTMQHIGQINYIRGLIESRIWYTGNIEEKR